MITTFAEPASNEVGSYAVLLVEELQEAPNVKVLGDGSGHGDQGVEEAKVEVVHGGVNVDVVFVASTLSREQTMHLCVCVCVVCVCA